MANTTTHVSFGGAGSRVVYCSEDVPGAAATRLAAAVVWRAALGSRARGWRARLRRWRFRLGPLGAGFHLRGMRRQWGGSARPEGEQETRYHYARRLVWVLGRTYAVPADGRTLVLLIDEGAGPGAAPRVVVRTVTAPVLPDPVSEPTEDLATDDDRRAGEFASQSRAWAAALERDPEVRAFMGGSPSATG